MQLLVADRLQSQVHFIVECLPLNENERRRNCLSTKCMKLNMIPISNVNSEHNVSLLLFYVNNTLEAFEL